MINFLRNNTTNCLYTNGIALKYYKVFYNISNFLSKKSSSKKDELLTINNYCGNIKITINKNQNIGNTIYYFGFYEYNVSKFLVNYLKPEMNFVDIGANIGSLSLLAASIVKNGNVYAFEPVDKNFSVLEQNIKDNNYNNIKAYHFGLSDKEQELEIFTNAEANSNLLLSVYATETRNQKIQTIQLKRLDDVLAGVDKIDFIKIDIEGSELYALKGAYNTLKKDKPCLLIEMNQETFKSAGYTSEELIDYLKSNFGYEPYTIVKDGALQKGLLPDSAFENVVFM